LKTTKTIIALLFLGISSDLSSQLDDLTPEEIAYRDSITELNLENESIANSQEAYNRGIELFGLKKYSQAIKEFKKSIDLDPSFTAAYYNKGVAENESEKFSDGVVTLSQLIKTYPSYSKPISNAADPIKA